MYVICLYVNMYIFLSVHLFICMCPSILYNYMHEMCICKDVCIMYICICKGKGTATNVIYLFALLVTPLPYIHSSPFFKYNIDKNNILCRV